MLLCHYMPRRPALCARASHCNYPKNRRWSTPDSICLYHPDHNGSVSCVRGRPGSETTYRHVHANPGDCNSRPSHYPHHDPSYPCLPSRHLYSNYPTCTYVRSARQNHPVYLAGCHSRHVRYHSRAKGLAPGPAETDRSRVRRCRTRCLLDEAPCLSARVCCGMAGGLTTGRRRRKARRSPCHQQSLRRLPGRQQAGDETHDDCLSSPTV
mmetsp:Transcript_1196/g.4230  ORF Transcript_1196/g.4230 Transcript_1196/m.4230 type:complete len:210 (-) Transcript_1196:389-1018(-)|eukprot:scaffold7222_cov535-Prasinococcus_capsulatus_cf.AAC.12